MSDRTTAPVAVLDANVLYPFRQRDILLTFQDARLIEARWTEEIVREWTGALLGRKPWMTESLATQVSIMRSTFPSCWVTGHQGLAGKLTLPDLGDRHVLAAAITAQADFIVTQNLRDFPAETLAPLGLRAASADAFLASVCDQRPSDSAKALEAVRLRYRNPPYSAEEFVIDLVRKGLPKLASRAYGFEARPDDLSP